MDSHVLVDFHVGDKKEVFEIAGAIASAVFGIGDGAIDLCLVPVIPTAGERTS
jgi:hypothetical protein